MSSDNPVCLHLKAAVGIFPQPLTFHSAGVTGGCMTSSSIILKASRHLRSKFKILEFSLCDRITEHNQEGIKEGGREGRRECLLQFLLVIEENIEMKTVLHLFNCAFLYPCRR